MNWTQEEDDEIRRGASEGLSSTLIATKLAERFAGFRVYTRNTIIARAWRMGVKIDAPTQTAHRLRTKPKVLAPLIEEPNPRWRARSRKPGRILATISWRGL